MDDNELIRAVRRGDRGAFEMLYRRHKDAVYRYACALCGRVADAEDLVQEAFLGLLRNADRLDERRAVAPYLLRSVRNRHVDRMRSFAARAGPLPEEEPPSRDGSPEGAAADNERLAALARALARLPASHRDVVELHVFAGLTYEAIAAERETSAAAVRSRYRGAIATLRTLLGRSVANE